VSRGLLWTVVTTPIFAGVLLAVCSTPAEAAFAVCNKTDHAASVALGFYDGVDWGSTGWWTVAAGACARIVNEPLVARYYYLYAVHQDIGGAWEGDHSFCVGGGRFSIKGRGDCSTKGSQAKKFFQVDTGQSRDWIENLAD
jgi:uncharacterized membrane protein